MNSDECSEWDAAASTYESKSESATGFVVERYVTFVAPTSGQLVADIACGPGVIALALAQAGAAVKALDLSGAMVERLREPAVDAGLDALVETYVGDAAALPFGDDACDAAVSNFGLIFCPDIDGALRELTRVTKRGGALMISAWTVATSNGWTSLLPADVETVLGFEMPPRPMYRWSTADDLASACAGAGWSDVTVETTEGVPQVLTSAGDVGEAFESPATKANLRDLSDEQRLALRELVAQRAREVFGDGEVVLPREAWLARGRA